MALCERCGEFEVPPYAGRGPHAVFCGTKGCNNMRNREYRARRTGELKELRAMRTAIGEALEEAAVFAMGDRVERLAQIRDSLAGIATVSRARQRDIVRSGAASGYPWAEFELLMRQIERQAQAADTLVLEVLSALDAHAATTSTADTSGSKR